MDGDLSQRYPCAGIDNIVAWPGVGWDTGGGEILTSVVTKSPEDGEPRYWVAYPRCGVRVYACHTSLTGHLGGALGRGGVGWKKWMIWLFTGYGLSGRMWAVVYARDGGLGNKHVGGRELGSEVGRRADDWRRYKLEKGVVELYVVKGTGVSIQLVVFITGKPAEEGATRKFKINCSKNDWFFGSACASYVLTFTPGKVGVFMEVQDCFPPAFVCAAV
ncbi:hypothetical protein Tco_1071211 [Tanacetum coccineum]|uniref:Uncharacterized protein n=1 Tax=Tanacetum coccineum TaxID=301880 RepID=A0ABQ5HPM3_9ASTR